MDRENQKIAQNYRSIGKMLGLSFCFNFLLAIGKMSAGFFGSSFSLFSDGLDSLIDGVTTVFMFIGLKFAQKPPDNRHPYGHGRIELLMSFFMIAVFVVSGFYIVIEAVTKMTSPQPLPHTYTLYVLVITWILKETASRLFLKKSKVLDSVILRADATHHRLDGIGSLFAFLGILLSFIFGNKTVNFDALASLASAVIILINAYKIASSSIMEMMDTQNYDEIQKMVDEAASEVPNVINTEKCFIRKIGISYFIEIHVRVPGNLNIYEGHRIAHMLKDRIMKICPQVENVFTHIEPFDPQRSCQEMSDSDFESQTYPKSDEN